MTNQRSGHESTHGANAAREHASGRGSTNGDNVASTITSQVQGALDQQVVRGARTITSVAQSAKRAADELESDAPQIAGLVRGVAERVEEYSRTLENQSIADIYQTASDFTRRQPAVVFGVAALAGFFALRTFKSSAAAPESRKPVNRPQVGEFHGS
jgi:ElaB/YqjD/DUF883 family membrane-anchored ribosome-binding protein